MYRLLRFAGPGKVEIIESQSVALQPGEVRVRTLFSGISAGTEMTAYRGTNPYLTSVWNPGIRLFQQDLREPRLGYPLDGWGYSEVGEVVEVAAVPDPVDEGKDAGRPVKVGDTVWGIWGHQSEAILPAKTVAGHQLPEGMDPLAAVFVRVGAIALNAVLAADLGVGSTVAIFGQGVIGLLATRFAVLNGATVIAVDGIRVRQNKALAWGAEEALAPDPDPAARIRELTGGMGCDCAIELSGNYRALHEATRAVGADGTVVAAGFYQGGAAPLRLGEEFHHNRVQILASQIGSVPNRLRTRWSVPRLEQTVIASIASGALDTASLVTHRFDVADAAKAYELLDNNPESALQTVLEFR